MKSENEKISIFKNIKKKLRKVMFTESGVQRLEEMDKLSFKERIKINRPYIIWYIICLIVSRNVYIIFF